MAKSNVVDFLPIATVLQCKESGMWSSQGEIEPVAGEI